MWMRVDFAHREVGGVAEGAFVSPELAQWAEEWRQTRALTYELLRTLPYAVMNFSPHPDFGTFIRQMRHVADIQACYVAATHTGKMDFSAQPRQRALEHSKEDVEAYMRDLDAQLLQSLQTLSAQERGRPIAWGDERVSLLQHLMRLLQHETLHHGMWTFYAKVADLPLPASWNEVWALT